jgi:hypothetical protein
VLAGGVISGVRMLNDPETIWWGVAALGVVCVLVITSQPDHHDERIAAPACKSLVHDASGGSSRGDPFGT